MQTQPKYTHEQIEKRIDNCPKLASLRSINNALSELVHAEQSFTSQIAEIIRRDPTLTTRLLKLVNSVFFGLSKRVTHIEDAIFYLGLKQIRELALATPVIEDFNRLKKGNERVDWRMLWQHSIGTAIITREVASIANLQFEDDTDYIAGLVHNVGHIVKASVFPEEFEAMLGVSHPSLVAECEAESACIGWSHAEMGAYYLSKHQLSEEVVDAVKYHHHPQHSVENPRLSAAVQIADNLVRTTEIIGIEDIEKIEDEDEEQAVSLLSFCQQLSGWDILFADANPLDYQYGLNSLRQSLERLPGILKGIV